MSAKYDYRSEIMDIKPYVPGKPIEEVKRELGISDVTKMASNENPLGVSPKAKEAMIKYADKMNIYPDGYCFDLRRDLADKLDVKGNNLIFGNGSDEIIKLLSEVFVKPGDEVLTAYPSFSEYDFATYLMGGELKKTPLNNYKFDLEEILSNISSKTKLIFICNPNNPTGTYVTDEELERFLSKVPEQVIVVFDEAYQEYVSADDFPETLKYIKNNRENVIILRTFSKMYALAGLRIGYGIASENLINLLSRAKEPFNVNYMSQVAALAAINDIEHIKKTKKVNSEGKKFLYESFEKLELDYISSEANFIMVNTKKDSKEVFNSLLKKGVIIRTGDIFGMNKFIRVTIGTAEQNQKFIKELKHVLDLF
jgi:histidinol-phosphate aminotransferase